MQNNIKNIYMHEKNVNGTYLHTRRTSTSGFEYPNDLYSTHYPLHFPIIPEVKYQNLLSPNNYHFRNGDEENKPDTTNQSFYSENNINLTNQTELGSFLTNTLDPRYHFNDSNFIPRFSSTPLIPQSYTKQMHSQNHFNDTHPVMSPSISNNTYSEQISSHSQSLHNDTSFPPVQSQYVLYDLMTNSYQNVVFCSPTPNERINEKHKVYYNGNKHQPRINDYDDVDNLSSQEPSDMTDNYVNCQLNLVQHNKDNGVYSDFVKDDLIYFLPPEMSDNIGDINHAESQSMPSLNGDDDVESEFESSDDDQLNTVHGDEMLRELQKLSSVFTNVVNLPMSRNNSVIGSTDFPGHSSLSRFKKTRIEERTTFWRKQRFIVKDNMVKIIPDKVLNIKPMDMERLNQLELSVLGCQISKPAQSEAQDAVSYPRDCVHSTYLSRSSKHSSRIINQIYRSSYNSISPTNIYSSTNQQMPSHISSRNIHRKSLQIPVRIPYVLNPLSPSVQHRNRTILESTNISKSKSSRLKRRWSLGGLKTEKNCSIPSLRSHNPRQSGELINRIKYNSTNEYFDHRQSFDLHDLDECSGVFNPQIHSNLESKLDRQLVSLKRTVMSLVDSTASEMKEEVRSLRSTYINLGKELQFYKDKVQLLEQSIRQNLPEKLWELYGIDADNKSELDL